MRIIESHNCENREPSSYDVAQLLDSDSFRSIGINPILRKTCIQISDDVSRVEFEDMLADIMEMDTHKQSSIIYGTYPPASLSTSRFMIFNSPDTTTTNGSTTTQPTTVTDRSFKAFLDILATSYGGTQRGDNGNAVVKLNCSLISVKSGRYRTIDK